MLPLCWILVKVPQEPLGIHEVFWWFPCVFALWVVFPFDQVHGLSVDFIHVSDGLCLVDFRSCDLSWFIAGFDVYRICC